MNNQHNEWLENWFGEAERLFSILPAVPAHMESEMRQLISFTRRAKDLTADIREARARWAKQLQDKREAEARVAEIVERQRAATEREITEREMRKLQRQLEGIKAEIDRITDNIVREMRKRRIAAQEWQIAQVEEARRKMSDDLAVWEAFKRSLHEPGTPQPIDIDQSQIDEENAKLWALYTQNTPPKEPLIGKPLNENAEIDAESAKVWEAFKARLATDKDQKIPDAREFIQEEQKAQRTAEQERLAAEIKAAQDQEIPSEEENRAAWDEFLQEINPQEKKRRKVD